MNNRKQFTVGIGVGICICLMSFLLMGASKKDPIKATTSTGDPVIFVVPGPKDQILSEHVQSQIGKYQISSWATSWGKESGGYGAFITDTTTGETKTAYSYVFAENGKKTASTNNLNKKFDEILK